MNLGKHAERALFVISLLVHFKSNSVVLRSEEILFDDKRIIFLCDFHNISFFKEREKEELLEFIEILQKRATTSNRELVVLLEHFDDGTEDQIGILISLYKKIQTGEVKIEGTTFKNIEIRTQSTAAAKALKKKTPQNRFSSSSLGKASMDDVTFNDVFKEIESLKNYLNKKYTLLDSDLRDAYQRTIKNCDNWTSDIYDLLKASNIDFDEPIVDIVKNCIKTNLINELVDLIMLAPNKLFDCYLLHTICDLPPNSEVIVVTGYHHALRVRSKMQEAGGTLLECRGASDSEIYEKKCNVPPLTKEQLDYFTPVSVAVREKLT